MFKSLDFLWEISLRLRYFVIEVAHLAPDSPISHPKSSYTQSHICTERSNIYYSRCFTHARTHTHKHTYQIHGYEYRNRLPTSQKPKSTWNTQAHRCTYIGSEIPKCDVQTFISLDMWMCCLWNERIHCSATGKFESFVLSSLDGTYASSYLSRVARLQDHRIIFKLVEFYNFFPQIIKN